MTDEHTDDVDPRGIDFDDPRGIRKVFSQLIRSIKKACPVCGEIHKEEHV